MSDTYDHIVFAGGGTAGHLFPGLAVADLLAEELPGLRITFAGSGKPFEQKHVARAGHAYVTLPCRPFPRRAREALRFVVDNTSGYYAARRLLADENVSLVVGLGGYASVPAARAAARMNIPFVLLEQNAWAGRATRWLAPRASAVCAAFAGIGAQLRNGCRVQLTGNPLRRTFNELKPVVPAAAPAGAGTSRLAKPQRLIVLGGSGGASVLNQQVPRALYKSAVAVRTWQVVHQSGERDLAATRELYRKLGIRATVSAFIDDLPRLLDGSQLAISRAGGSTLAELAASGVPAILLPFPLAADDHQRKNADVFASAGACQLLDERELSGRLDNHVAKAVVELATDHPRRERMATAMRRLARPDAARRVATLIGELLAARQAVGA